MPQVQLEPTTPVFEQAKTVHALVHGAVVIIIILLTRQNKDKDGE
jgi:hypothetical protein